MKMSFFTRTLLFLFTVLTLSQGSAQVLGSLKFDGTNKHVEIPESPLNEI